MSYTRRFLSTLLAASLAMCSILSSAQEGELTPGRLVSAPNDRLHVETQGDLRITAAVPSAAETEEIFGADLYRVNVQPVWIQVENLGDQPLLLTPMGLDPDYYTARETATLARSGRSELPRSEHFEQRVTEVTVPPRSIQSGYIFSGVDEGTKSFNVDVIGGGSPHMMSFFVPVPGLRVDHYDVDAGNMYPKDEIQQVNLEELVAALEAMPCCVRDKAGENTGDPLNLVFIGDIKDIYHSFMRAGWDETETIYQGSLLKTANSAIFGEGYRYSPVSALYVFGRPQDTALQRARGSINERNHLRIWVTPLRFEGKPVWIGQISRDIGVHFTSKTITTHKIDPNVDETREFLVEDLAYAESLKKFGYVGGVGAAPYEAPRGNLTGDPYFTDGKRVVMWISSKPTSIREIERIRLSQPAWDLSAP